MKALSAGAVVCVVATDPGIATDMPMWCRATRNEHLGTFREGAVLPELGAEGGAGP